MDSWSELYRHRQIIKKEFPSVWTIPLVKKELDLLLPNIADGDRVLELGAGDRRFGRKLQTLRNSLTYSSFDIDPNTEQDYYVLNEIEGTFDCIFTFELIEHLTPDQGFELLRTAHGLLAPGGVLIVGTPNLYHPHRYWGDLTHKTPYKYEELGALLLLAGFSKPKFFRIYNDAFIRRFITVHLGVLIHRYLDIDFAGTMLVRADK